MVLGGVWGERRVCGIRSDVLALGGGVVLRGV